MNQYIAEPVPVDGNTPKPTRLSDVFTEMARLAEGPVSIAAIRDALGERSLAALLLFFAALNMLPLRPARRRSSGFPLVIISAQMVYGARTAWLPAFVLRKSFTEAQFRQIVAAMVPQLQRLERLVDPLLAVLAEAGRGERIVGGVALIMAISVTLPIPLGNWLPAFSTALLALALTERDGVFLGAGCVVGAVAMMVIAFVVGSAGMLAHFVWAKVF